MLVFNVLIYREFAAGRLLSSYLTLNARISAAVIRLLGEDAVAVHSSIVSRGLNMEIRAGCDAIQASAFFVFVVLASPVRVTRLRRLLAVVLGVGVLLALNLVRIVTLYFAAVYWKSGFDFVHGEAWQAVFIFLPLGLWLVWLRQVTSAKAVS